MKAVLISLADQANDAGVCWPSVGTLAKRTCYKERACQKALATLEELGHITKEERAGRSTIYHIHPGGALHAPLPRTTDTPTPAPRAPGGAPRAPRIVTEPPLESKPAGQSPTAQCAEAYRQGIKAKYGADYPPSAKLNGIMARLVQELGAEPALRVVRAYMASSEKWYVLKRHALEYLKRDAAQIWIQLQERSGAAGAPPEKAVAFLDFPDARPESRLCDYPVEDPEAIARRVVRDYGKRLPGWGARNIIVQIGARRHPFSIVELST